MIKEALRELSKKLVEESKRHESAKDQKCAQIILARTGLARLQEKISSSTKGERNV